MYSNYIKRMLSNYVEKSITSANFINLKNNIFNVLSNTGMVTDLEVETDLTDPTKLIVNFNYTPHHSVSTNQLKIIFPEQLLSKDNDKTHNWITNTYEYSVCENCKMNKYPGDAVFEDLSCSEQNIKDIIK